MITNWSTELNCQLRLCLIDCYVFNGYSFNIPKQACPAKEIIIYTENDVITLPDQSKYYMQFNKFNNTIE